MQGSIQDDFHCRKHPGRICFDFILAVKILVISCFIIHLTAMAGLGEEKTVVIKVNFRDVSELLPMVRDMISQNGKVSMDVRTNSIILSDNNESIEYIRSFVARLDKPLERLIVRVRLRELSGTNNSSARARGRISGENWEIETHEQEQDGVHIQMNKSLGKKNLASDFFLSVQSGGAAYIILGEEVLFTKKWDSLLREYSGHTEEFTPDRIESGLEIKPVIIGDHVDIEIIPRISRKVKKHGREIIRFTEMSTYLSVNLGQWVTISGMGNAGNEVVREILGTGSGKRNSSLIVSLMVEAK